MLDPQLGDFGPKNVIGKMFQTLCCPQSLGKQSLLIGLVKQQGLKMLPAIPIQIFIEKFRDSCRHKHSRFEN